MQPSKTEEQTLDKQLDEICGGFCEAVDREIEILRREGLPIYVADNGRIVDLQEENHASSLSEKQIGLGEG